MHSVVIRGYLPNEQRILVHTECILANDVADVGVTAPLQRINLELKIVDQPDEKIEAVLRLRI